MRTRGLPFFIRHLLLYFSRFGPCGYVCWGLPGVQIFKLSQESWFYFKTPYFQFCFFFFSPNFQFWSHLFKYYDTRRSISHRSDLTCSLILWCRRLDWLLDYFCWCWQNLRNEQKDEWGQEGTYVYFLFNLILCVIYDSANDNLFIFFTFGGLENGVWVTCSSISDLKSGGFYGFLHFPNCFEHVFSLILPNVHILVAYRVLGTVLSIQNSCSHLMLRYCDCPQFAGEETEACLNF